MNKKTITYVVVFLAGVVLASKVKSLPVLNQLPSL
jgi:hypothetical protein